MFTSTARNPKLAWGFHSFQPFNRFASFKSFGDLWETDSMLGQTELLIRHSRRSAHDGHDIYAIH
jgi:hypothetical protein